MKIEVIVDKRSELLGVLLLLSDYNKKFPFLIEERNNKEYRQKIFDNFNKFKDEKAVKLINRVINELNFCYDAPVSLFLQLNEDFTYDNLHEYPFYLRLKKSSIVLDLLEELPNFAKKINFNAYYESNNAFYNSIINQTSQNLDIQSVKEFLIDFYKNNFIDKEIKINLLPYTTNGNFGVHFGNVIIPSLGVNSYDKDMIIFSQKKSYGSLVVHEFSHAIVNPLTSKYAKNISGECFVDIWEQMVKIAYGNKDTIINEHVIRAIQIIHLKHFIKTEKALEFAEKRRVNDLNIGFKYIDACINSIENYYLNKEKYLDFETYYPQLLEDVFKATKNKVL